MPSNNINCTGIPCPQPVILVKKAIENNRPQSLAITVDNAAALENVTRFLNKNGYTTTYEETDHASPYNQWIITAHNNSTEAETQEIQDVSCDCAVPNAKPAAQQKTLVFIISPVVGTGDNELGAKLMKNFLATLPELGNELWRIVLLNGGVTLATKNSPVISELLALEADGISILVCGSCLEHFKLLEQKAVGETTNMLDVVTSLQLADKIIRI